MTALKMATLVNGRYVETHDVSDTEADLWKSLVGIDLRKLAVEGPRYVPDNPPTFDTVKITPGPDMKGRTEEIAKQDREREALVRALHAAEKAGRKLPKHASAVAGFLFTQGVKGNDTPTGNPLAKYFKRAITDALADPSAPSYDPKNITVYAEASGVSVETGRFQLLIEPVDGAWPFLEGHRAGRFPELWEY